MNEAEVPLSNNQPLTRLERKNKLENEREKKLKRKQNRKAEGLGERPKRERKGFNFQNNSVFFFFN